MTGAMKPALRRFVIGIPLYEGVNVFDAISAYEVFSWMQSSLAKRLTVELSLVAETMRPVVTRENGLVLTPQKTFREMPRLDLLWVPGGDANKLVRAMQPGPYRTFLQSRARTAQYVTSVCEGALLLASAGLLDGYRATTHWEFIPCLKRYPRIKIARGFPRFVVNRRRDAAGRTRYVVTGGGVASGLDESLELVRLIAGRAVAEEVQTTIQYFPKPPVHGRIVPATSCPLPAAPPKRTTAAR